MIFKYITIFLFFLQLILVVNSKNFPVNKEINRNNVLLKAPCNDYYGLFVLDNSISGHKMLSMQLTIVDFFFDFASSSNYSALATVTSQSATSVTNNFSVVPSNDYAALNSQINTIIQQTSNGSSISYFNLVVQALQLNLFNSSIYTNNPVMIFFVDSPIQDLNSTSEILKNLNIKNYNKVKFLAIAMDPQYSEQAEQLVDGANNVYTYNSTDQNNYNNIIDFILQQSCPSSSISTTISPGDHKPPCDSYVNIVIDSSNKLPPLFYKSEIDLIENDILPMWNNFSKISTLIMYNDTEVLYRDYNNDETLDYIKNFIDSSGQSTSSVTFLRGAMYILNNNQDYLQHRSKMSTFVFLTKISKDEIEQAAQDATNLALLGKLNIVVMGTSIKTSDLAPLHPSNTFSWDFIDNNVDSIQEFFRNNLMCI